MKLYIVIEYGTSRECSICHIEHEGARIYRGLYVCEKTGKKLNTDLNDAVNIAHRAGYVVAVSMRIESYRVTHNGVMPITPAGGGKHETLACKGHAFLFKVCLVPSQRACRTLRSVEEERATPRAGRRHIEPLALLDRIRLQTRRLLPVNVIAVCI